MTTSDPHCVDLVRRHDRDRFLTVQFAPAEARAGLYALYAFNHEVARAPESTNEPLLARMRVQWWADAMDGIVQGQPPDHPVARALGVLAERGVLERTTLDALIDARASDAAGERSPADMNALEDYLDATAAGLGALALAAIDPDAGAGARRAVRHAGLAWGLTGLLRALPFHAARRRCFLPRALCAEAGVDVEALLAGRRQEGVARVVRTLAAQADEHVRAARRERDAISARSLAVVLPVTLAESHLHRLAKAGNDPFHPAIARPTGPGGVLRLIWRGWRGRF